jgi:hypothetical protein
VSQYGKTDMARGVKRARLDADRTARPMTRLARFTREGDCVGPGAVRADAYEAEDGSRTPLAPQLSGSYWNGPVGIEKLVGRSVRVVYKDGTEQSGNVLSADGDLGSVTLAWTDGPRSFTCTFRVHDVVSVKAE